MVTSGKRMLKGADERLTHGERAFALFSFYPWDNLFSWGNLVGFP